MLLNYHEMTMTESSDSPQKKRQFALICAVMVAALSYSIMTSGAMLAIEPTQGIFPGGYFCYKLARRDYAASLGLGRRITNDLIGEKAPKAEKQTVEESMYYVFLDDPSRMGGRRQRWATGILGGDSQQEQRDHLLALNVPASGKNKKRYPTEQESKDMSATTILEMLPYESGDLPSVDALIVQFPHTHGFVSSLVVSYRIIPTLRKMVVEKGGEGTVPIVIMNCRKEDDMCTFFAPLVQTSDFLFGQPDTDTLLAGLPKEQVLDWEGFKQGGRKVFPFARKYIDMLP